MPTKLLSLTPNDIGDRLFVEVSLEPKSTQDEVSLANVAQIYRTPGANGHPLMSDEDINRYVFKRPHPERIQQSVELQMLESANPEVAQIKQAALLAMWRKNHKELVKLAENPEGEKMITMTEDKFREQVEMAAKLMVAQAQGAPVDAMLGAAMQANQSGPQAAPPGMAGAGMQQMGGGMQQAAMPEQFQMTPADMIPEPSADTARRQKRGKPQHKPATKRGY